MVKKVLLWAKTTDLWVKVAQIYTVFLCLFVLKCHLWGTDYYDKIVGLLAFALLIVLVLRYNLYKRIAFGLYALFFVFTYISGYLEGAGFMRIIGSQTHRNWYIYLLAMVVGMVSEGKGRNRWINTLFSIQAFLLSIIFTISIYGATKKLFNPDYEVLKGFGTFVSGRLSTFTSANTAGPAAGVLILISLLLLYRLRENKFKVLLNILHSIYLFIGCISLGLTRSRGAILAAAAGIGTICFVIIYDRLKERRAKAVLIAMLACMLVSVSSAALLLLPKPIYDKVVIDYIESRQSEAADETKEKLEVYGITYSLENLTDRTEIWSATINMLNEKPKRWIFGITAQYAAERRIYDIYENRPEIATSSTHSGYVQQLYFYGIPGAVLLAILLIRWIICAACAVFSDKVATEEKAFSSLMIAAFVNAFVEAFLFPHYVIYPISFYFFIGEGCLEGSMEKKKSSIKKRVLIILGIVIVLALGIVLTKKMYDKSMAEYKAVKEITVKEQCADDFVRLNNSVEDEMMSADYWINAKQKTGVDTGAQRLSLSEISRLNALNRRMITTPNAAFSLREIDEVFYYKVAKELINATMMKVDSPTEYILNDSATSADFWDSLYDNANVEGLTERIAVKFGVSVSRTVLKRYPTDAKVYSKSSNLYYDELAQSDFLPFMPVAVLHESADAEWYYVITYGYGGWIRKECIALCESKEDWLERFDPEDFIVVTGKEIRLSSDPYTEQLSDMLIPMGTKLPILSLKDAPEDIHDRVGYGNYIAKLPIRNENGMAEDIYVLIPTSEDVNLGYLPYTEENVAKLAFKHLGAVYGWAGDNNGQDCSGYTREIYACFGYSFPRSAVAQSEMESTKSYDVKGKSSEEMMSILKDAPIGTLLYFPGHIMMYVGNVDGRPYCISSVGNFATTDMEAGKTIEVNTVILTEMLNTTRADGKSWLESVTKIVEP